MSMTSTDDIDKWFEGTQLYDGGDVEGALKSFAKVTQNSRILFNVGCCYLSINDVEAAAENYKAAVEHDQHFAVGYFMVGFASFLQQDYQSAMDSLTKSRKLLRGHRFVDYKQLGLNYQLYSCEILSNQAVMAYHLKQFDKAKEYLLEAVGCKAEPRHNATFEMLIALQVGDEITPYVIPKNQIFRPPKSYVQNLKKKDYLGKATVITTDNEEDIYACFSGIKEEIMNKSKNKDTNNSKTEEGVVRPRRRAETRSIMLNELRKPEREKTLKKTLVKKKQPSIALGRVVVGPQESNDLSKNGVKISKPKPLSPCPTRRSPSAVTEDNPEYRTSSTESGDSSSRSISVESTNSLHSPQTHDEMRFPSISKTSDSDSDESPYETIRGTNRKGLLNIPKGKIIAKERFSSPDVMSNQKQSLQNPNLHLEEDSSPSLQEKRFSTTDVQLEREKRLSLAFSKPLKKPPPLFEAESEGKIEPVVGSLSRLLKSKRCSTADIGFEKEKKMSLAVVKPLKKTPSLFEAKRETEKKLSSVSSSEQSDSGIDERRANSNTQIKSNYDKQETNKTKDSNKNKVKKARNVEVEVQYTFVKKLRIPVGCDLKRLSEIVKCVHVPDQVELCYQDSLGRQRGLSDEDLEGVLFRPSKPQKVFCYPEM